MSLFLNGKRVDHVLYPNNETLLRPDVEEAANYTIVLRFESDADLFRLQILKKYLDEISPDSKRPCCRRCGDGFTRLVIPYMPYSRALFGRVRIARLTSFRGTQYPPPVPSRL